MAHAYQCVLYDRKDGKLNGLVALQVDDKFGVGTEKFMNKKATKSRILNCKPGTMFGTYLNKFNGLRLRQEKHGKIIKNQVDKINSLSPPNTQKEFAITRAKIR